MKLDFTLTMEQQTLMEENLAVIDKSIGLFISPDENICGLGRSDLYQVCQESGLLCDLSWDDFVLLIRGHKSAREVAMVVVRETLKDFYCYGHYTFDVTDVEFLRDSDAEGEERERLHCSSLFSPEEGSGLAEGILFRAEVSQYRRLIDHGEGYTWQEYLNELGRKGPLWDQVYAAFQDALAKLAFKPVWKSEHLEDLIRRVCRRCSGMETIIDLLPLDLGMLGTVTEGALVMPGVYDAILEFLETGLAMEAFIMLSNAGEISAAAKRYGKTDPDYPDLLVYSENETGNTRFTSVMSCSAIRYCTTFHCRRTRPSAAFPLPARRCTPNILAAIPSPFTSHGAAPHGIRSSPTVCTGWRQSSAGAASP